MMIFITAGWAEDAQPAFFVVTARGQLSRQNTANCRVKNQPTVESKYGQLAHLLQKNSGI